MDDPVLQGWTEYTRFFVTLVAVLDPFLAVPVYLTVTAGRSEAYRRGLTRVIVLTVFSVLAGSAFFGDALLQLMGASLAAFKVGGGIVLMMMAFAMLNAQTGGVRQSPQEADELEAAQTSGVVPLAVPLLAGPGAIGTTIIAVQKGSGTLHLVGIVGCIAAVCALLWVTLRLAGPIGARLGLTGLNIATRLLGLILTAIAVETMAQGLKQLFPVLAGA
jgi:multiple antibiotic resistance protein